MSFLPHNATELPKDEEEQILAAIGESEHSRKVCVEKLRNILKDKECNTSLEEEFLLSYLRRSDFKCDKAAYAIEVFSELQRDSPEYFQTCVLGALTKASLNPCRISPFRLKDNSILLIHEYFKTDLSELPLTEKMYLDVISTYYLMRNPVTQICGVTVIMDFADVSMSKIPQYTDYTWITLGVNLMKIFPGRIKSIHLINVSGAATCAYNLFLPFLPQRVVDLLHFHSDSIDFKDLHEFVPPEVLPEKYGGHLKESELISCMENILKKENYFRKHFPLGTTK